MSEFKQYKRKSVSEMCAYEEGMVIDHVSISEEDKKAGSPKVGDMIARNPKNHNDQWLVAKQYFEDNLEVAEDLSIFDFSLDMTEQQSLSQEVKCDKNLRVFLDKGLQKLKDLPRSRERSLSITKLQEAIMWLGMDLKRLNEPNPYPDSYKPENTKIAPTADGLKL